MKVIRDKLKEEQKKFDVGNIVGMVLFNILSEEILEGYVMENTPSADMQMCSRIFFKDSL